jgi:transposase InsO family protein
MQHQRGYKPKREAYLLIRITDVYQENKGRYGSRRIYYELQRQGVICYMNQVATIMKKYGIKAKRSCKFKHTTDSNHGMPIAPNLLCRNFSASAPNTRWVGDISYIWTEEGWLYLSAITDLYSRFVVSWNVDKRLTKDLVIRTFKSAIESRRPAPGLIFHSDRGSQYASKEFRDVLEEFGVRQSMSRKGDCWDNAVAESFFKTIKSELVYWTKFPTRSIAELRIFEYIEMFYNRRRLHSTLNYRSPEQYEKEQ